MKKYVIFIYKQSVSFLKQTKNETYIEVYNNYNPSNINHTYYRKTRWRQHIVLETDSYDEAISRYIIETI